MSRLRCECGHVILDHDQSLDYKARLISDINFNDFSDWIAVEIQEYMAAVNEGKVKQWLSSKGYKEDYIDLNLDHGNILHDHIMGYIYNIIKDAYECTKCGRLHVVMEDNSVISFFPKNGKFNALFCVPTNRPNDKPG